MTRTPGPNWVRSRKSRARRGSPTPPRPPTASLTLLDRIGFVRAESSWFRASTTGRDVKERDRNWVRSRKRGAELGSFGRRDRVVDRPTGLPGAHRDRRSAGAAPEVYDARERIDLRRSEIPAGWVGSQVAQSAHPGRPAGRPQAVNEWNRRDFLQRSRTAPKFGLESSVDLQA